MFILISPDEMASPGNERMKSYKNKALNPQEMRRRREEEGIQLRKQKREEQVGASSSYAWTTESATLHSVETTLISSNLTMQMPFEW